MLGKTNTPEYGWKGDTTNRVVGSTHNPWEHDRSAGGSSGGAAAAVAAGLGPLAQGSDGAGSIRVPSSFCGIFGLKPSWGLVPKYPASAVEPLAHEGPMTRTVRDAALMLNVIAGADPRDRLSWSSGIDYLAALEGGIAGLRVAWTPDLGYAPGHPRSTQHHSQSRSPFHGTRLSRRGSSSRCLRSVGHYRRALVSGVRGRLFFKHRRGPGSARPPASSK